MQQEWNQEILYAFPPFSLIQRVFCKIVKERINTVCNIDNSSMVNSTLVSKSSCNVISLTLSTPNVSSVLKTLVINNSLALVAWKVTGKPWLSQAFQNELPILSLTQRDRVHQLITTRPGKNGVAGVI